VNLNNIIYNLIQRLNEELNIDNLLKIIIYSFFENTATDKVVIILKNKKNKKYFVEAEGYRDKKEIILHSINYDSNIQIPSSVILHVINTSEIINLTYPDKNERFVHDEYILNNKPSGIICIPLIHNQALIGIIYSESIAPKIEFSNDKNDFLKIIIPFISIALNNAQKYTLLNQSFKTEKDAYTLHKKYDRLNEDLLSDITLELSTHLNIISSITESLLFFSKGILPEDLNNKLLFIQNTSKRLLSFSIDIIDFYKIRDKGLKLLKEAVNLQKTAESSIAITKPLIDDKPIEIENHINEYLPFGYADEGKIQFVINKLLENSIKYLEKGNIIISANTKEDNIQISISDNGNGILSGDKNNYFISLEDVYITSLQDRSTYDVSLSICKYLVELHNGNIWVDAEVGKGTSYYFTLPIYNSEKVDKKEIESSLFIKSPVSTILEPIENIKKDPDYDYKILVVDDEPFIAQLINNYLTIQNYNIKTCYNSIEALKIIELEPEYDLIILDIMMPKMSGLEVARILRQKYSLFELPLLFITARNQVIDMIEGFEAGANDYLSKPFDGNELLARVKTLIKLKKLTKANLILQEAIEIKNQFINMTIHDLRNPLSVIQGLTTMMRQEIKEDSENAQLMDLVLESSSLMLRLVNELLEAVKIESGKLFLKKEVLNLNVICNEVVDKNRYRASQKGQNLVFSASDIDRCFINADNIRIHEAIDNLLNNAIKYSPLNSNIWINITPKKYDNKDYVRIEIKDEGPGLSEDDKQKIFGKFQRLSAQPTGGESSTGLGLSIVKELVELHDGRIWAESKMGDGSIFIIELPVSDYKVR